MKSLKTFFKEWLPPGLLKLIRRNQTSYFSGNYLSWQDALCISSGYTEESILEKVKVATLKVKLGEAAFERDSVTFDDIQYPFPILVALLQVALENKGHLNVLDFGGALGSSYYQCRNLLLDLQSLHWNIVEQAHFVSCGQQIFADETLKFYYTIDDCLEVESPQVILLSSVIQYLENPYEFIEKIVNYGFMNILIDRTAFTQVGGDLLTLQRVSPAIYSATYPAWFLDIKKFLSLFLNSYNLVFDFNSNDIANIPSTFKGFYFKKKP